MKSASGNAAEKRSRTGHGSPTRLEATQPAREVLRNHRNGPCLQRNTPEHALPNRHPGERRTLPGDPERSDRELLLDGLDRSGGGNGRARVFAGTDFLQICRSDKP